jgi:hypothetical protein
MTLGKKVALLLLMGTFIFPHLLCAETNLSGEYSCKGEDPDGTTYEGTANIEKVKDAYKIKWVVGQEKFFCVGIQSGDTASFAYLDAETKKDLGISVYKITEDGKVLTGKWVSYPGKTNLGKDVMTKK